MNSNLSNVEKLFTVIDQSAERIKQEEELTYLDALVETGENMFHKEIPEDVSQVTKVFLEKEYAKVKLEAMNREEIRKAFQLAVLKGMKEAIQPHHAMTPDAVGIFISYLVQKLMPSAKEFALLDPAAGAGNLLTTVLNQLEGNIKSFGVEVDETLLRLAWIISNLQKHNVEFYHQDSIKPLYVEPVDLVVCDLPVGFYPNDEAAKEFIVHANEGHTYAHHLLIEQSLHYLKESGFGVFLVPNGLFSSEQAPLLQKMIKEKAVIIGMIQLPLSLFKQESQAKSILLLQKNGENTVKPKQALLVDLPSFSKKQAIANVMDQMNEWFSEELKRP
ncbi:class I SAM-dependent methyltransferase [Fictibacillus enclensis]|uniref:DNA methylase n=1 Tax=Fictibacillus enclensis TaxID=1017270 RepID=A0A0V8J8Z2_9BACL|nr:MULTISPECIES: class I SAM-dependent methyltransferase [Fictibacillus]KSU83650.1 DNA methylase [Fictibacillus enclensis]MDM5339393.1 class I SAM-dependent methyltransferase [Fictibacillus enclensis]RXZ02474.1 class I SAM-dependent methyltransferase [Fictibacillus sp. S7]WHY70842.1 class I SAM-dependent methyltransferase [Fictibacillus enclensis]SCC18986.1 site-specific DNA-methyltransferase (adenine-specific) [Fictibacillus enclensis]